MAVFGQFRIRYRNVDPLARPLGSPEQPRRTLRLALGSRDGCQPFERGGQAACIANLPPHGHSLFQSGAGSPQIPQAECHQRQPSKRVGEETLIPQSSAYHRACLKVGARLGIIALGRGDNAQAGVGKSRA